MASPHVLTTSSSAQRVESLEKRVDEWDREMEMDDGFGRERERERERERVGSLLRGRYKERREGLRKNAVHVFFSLQR